MLEKGPIRIGGILTFRRLALLGVMSAPDRPGLAAAIFRALGQADLNVQFIVQSIDLNRDSHVQFCMAQEDLSEALRLIQPIAKKLDAERVLHRRGVCMLCIFGPDFRERPGIAGTAFQALGEAGINILAVSTSISTVTCVLEERDYERGMRALQAVFELP